MYSFSVLWLEFITFCFLGYVIEVIHAAFIDKKITNRGFLTGPVLPVWGIATMLSLLVTKSFIDNPVLVFLLSMITITIIEYFVAFLLERIFKNKWWDYSDRPFSIHGRVCLSNSLLYGVGGVISLYLLDAQIRFLISLLNEVFAIVIAFIIIIIFIADVVYSIIVAYNLRHRLIIVDDLKNKKIASIPGVLEITLGKRLKYFKIFPRRILDAYPNITKGDKKIIDIMAKIYSKEKKKRKKEKSKK